MKNNPTQPTAVTPPLTRTYPEKVSHRVTYKAGEFANHANPTVQESAMALRAGAEKVSYKAIATELGLQCDHFAYLAVHAAGKREQGWQAVTGGRAAKLARLADQATK